MLLYLSVQGMISAKKNRNQITAYMTYTAISMSVALLLYLSVPTFLITGRLAGWLVFVGDFFQFLALFWVWVVVIRIFLARQLILRKISYASIGILFGACTVVSWFANTNYATAALLKDGIWILDFAYPPLYAFVVALNFASLLLLGMYFLRESHKATVNFQRWRLRAFASCFIVIGGIFVTQPFFSFTFQSSSVSYLLAGGFVLLGLFSGLAFFKQAKKLV